MDSPELKIAEPTPQEKQRTARGLLVNRVRGRGEASSAESAPRAQMSAELPVVLDVEPLSEGDLQRMFEGDVEVAASEPFVVDASAGRLRALHHAVAMAVARGESPFDISRIHGISPRTVDLLQESPAFQELVRHYVSEGGGSFHPEQKIAAIAHESLDLIHNRLMKDGSQVSLDKILSISDSMLDRIGYGRTSRSVHLSVGLDGEDLEKIKSRPPARGELEATEPKGSGHSSGSGSANSGSASR